MILHVSLYKQASRAFTTDVWKKSSISFGVEWILYISLAAF